MNRREAISAVAWLLGGTVVGADLIIACTPKSEEAKDLFNADQVAMLDEVAETILPATNTPGAKAAGVGAFMTVMVKDCYKPEDQEVFTSGLKKLDEASDKKFGKKFMASSPQERTALLRELDVEQAEHQSSKAPDAPNHYFRMMKELTLLGYFTSEVGATQAMRYDPIPGKYDGCMPYKKGDKAWATA